MTKKKRPSILRMALELAIERVRVRRSLRLLSRQEWSLDFLESLLLRASERRGRPLQMTIHNGQNAITISTMEIPRGKHKSDSVFDRLDDDLFVEQFVREIQNR